MQRAVRTMPVVALDILPQHCGEMVRADQEMVEAFAAKRTDEPLDDRVRPRRPDRRADDANIGAGEHGVEAGGESGASGRTCIRSMTGSGCCTGCSGSPAVSIK